MKFASISLGIFYAASLFVAPVVAQQEAVFSVRGSNNKAAEDGVTGPTVNRRLRVPTGRLSVVDAVRPLHRRAKDDKSPSTPTSEEATLPPTGAPSDMPTRAPSDSPTMAPSETPTMSPTMSPSDTPTMSPTDSPTNACVNFDNFIQNDEDFSHVVVVKGDFLIAGNPDAGSPPKGEVKVYRKNSDDDFVLTQTINAPGSLNRFAQFGFDVDITETAGRQIIAIGAPGFQDGRVFLYEENTGADRGTFSRSQTYSSMTDDANDFGSSVAINEDNSLLVVGAPGTDNDRGSATVFQRTGGGIGWPNNGSVERDAKVQSNQERANERFGASTAISGTNYAIGAPNDKANGGNAGMVATYGSFADGGRLVALPADGSLGAGDRFGTDIAMDDQFLVIGSPRDFGNDRGSAYVYQRADDGNYFNIQKLEAFDSRANDRFGTSVSIGGDSGNQQRRRRIAVGSPRDNNLQGDDAGSVYVYSGARVEGEADAIFDLRNKIRACSTGRNSELGITVSVDNEGLLAAGGDEYVLVSDVSGTEIRG